MDRDDFPNDLSRRRARSRAESVRAHVSAETRRVRRNWIIFVAIVAVIVVVTLPLLFR